MSGIAKRIAPLADRVLVKRLLPQTKTASGLYLPDSAVQKENEGEVLAVGPGGFGPGGYEVKMTLVPGDKVLLPEFGGHKIEDGDDEVALFRHDDILAVLKK